MSVRLNWGAANAALADSIRIYRADAFIPQNPLPTPLATVAGSLSQWDDTTAVRNRTYHYRVGHVKGGEELISQDLLMGHYPDPGPGPKTIKRGDWNLGYFGFVAAADFIKAADFVTLTGIVTTGATVGSDANVLGWHKFIRKGKILYIPGYPILTGTTWAIIYNAGMVFGTDDTGLAPQAITTYTGVTALTNQKKLVTIQGYSFLVRLPKHSDTKATNVLLTATDIPTGEWVDLMGRLGTTTLDTSPQDKWDDRVVGVGTASISANFSSAVNAITTTATGPDVIGTSVLTSTSRAVYWMPVLELQF